MHSIAVEGPDSQTEIWLYIIIDSSIRNLYFQI